MYKIILIFIVLSALVNPNSLYAQDDDDKIPTRQEYAQALISALGADGLRFRQMIGALAAYCGTEQFFNSGLGGNCDRLFFEARDGNPDNIKRLLRRLRPREIVQSARTSTQVVSAQQANIATRLSQIRTGSNSLAQINIQNNQQSSQFNPLAYLADNNVQQLIPKWGFFINAQLTDGDYRYNDSRLEGYDFDSDTYTIGTDYRINNKAVVGFAIGHTKFNSRTDNQARAQTSSYTYSAYGSFNMNDNFYVDVKASFGKPDFKQQRVVDFTLGGVNNNFVVNGKTQGNQQSFVISTGYQINVNGWQITPNASAEYNKTTIDAFVETNNASFNVGFSEQNFKTTRLTLGFNLNKNISTSNGVVIPSLSYDYINENQNGDDVVLMRVSGMPAGEFFESPTGFNDSNYSQAKLGLTYVGSGGKQAYIQYAKTYGWDGFDKKVLNLGARFEF